MNSHDLPSLAPGARPSLAQPRRVSGWSRTSFAASWRERVCNVLLWVRRRPYGFGLTDSGGVSLDPRCIRSHSSFDSFTNC